MNVPLPPTWEQFVASQVSAGKFGDASEVVCEALRLLRDRQESQAVEELRAGFAGVDSDGGQGEPTSKDRALISQIVRRRRAGKARA